MTSTDFAKKTQLIWVNAQDWQGKATNDGAWEVTA